MEIAILETELGIVARLLNHIEHVKNININHAQKVAAEKTDSLTIYKAALEQEIFSEKIVQLCLTGR